jgi:YwiC-like protein
VTSATGDARARAPQPPASGRPARRLLRQWLPPQHGAWAMLLLPFGVGVLRAGPGWIHLPLLVAWVGGYLFSYYAQLAIKIRTTARVRDQLVGYGAVTAVAGTGVLLLRPALLTWVMAYVPLLVVNAWSARLRRERALVNGLASVLQGSLMTFVAADAVGAALQPRTGDAVVLALFFTGSLLYVRTMIRERGAVGYLSASIGFHVVALLVAGVVSAALLVPFGWFLARAAVLPRRSVSVRQVGLLELAGSLLLASVLVVAG